MGYLNLTNGTDTESRFFYNNMFLPPMDLTGNFVKDVISTSDKAALNYTYQKNISYEFFLIHKANGTKG
jgi:hypothetical protein